MIFDEEVSRLEVLGIVYYLVIIFVIFLLDVMLCWLFIGDS